MMSYVGTANRVFVDRARVADAVAHATTRRQALILLGVTPHSRAYRRLAEACEMHGLALPGSTHDREADTKLCGGCGKALPIERSQSGERQRAFVNRDADHAEVSYAPIITSATNGGSPPRTCSGPGT